MPQGINNTKPARPQLMPPDPPAGGGPVYPRPGAAPCPPVRDGVSGGRAAASSQLSQLGWRPWPGGPRAWPARAQYKELRIRVKVVHGSRFTSSPVVGRGGPYPPHGCPRSGLARGTPVRAPPCTPIQCSAVAPPSRAPPSRAALQLTPWPPSRPLASPSQSRAHACPHALRSPLLPLPCTPFTPAWASPWLPSITATPCRPPYGLPPCLPSLAPLWHLSPDPPWSRAHRRVIPRVTPPPRGSPLTSLTGIPPG